VGQLDGGALVRLTITAAPFIGEALRATAIEEHEIDRAIVSFTVAVFFSF